MPATSAIIGQGSKFAIGNGVDGSSTQYPDISVEITNIPGPELKRDVHDATHLNSPDNYREFIAGLNGVDPITLDFNFVPDASDTLLAHYNVGKGDYQITFPNGVRLQFSGIPTAWKPGDATADVMKGSMTIQPSGKPALLAPV